MSGDLDIVEEERVVGRYRPRSDVFRDVKWVWEIEDTKMLEVVRLAVRRWVDSVENFAQYIVRRLQAYGIVLQVDSNIYPVNDGYMLTIAFRIRGVKESTLRSKMRLLKTMFREATTGSSKFKRAEERMRLVAGDEREDRDYPAPIGGEEVEGEGGEAEG